MKPEKMTQLYRSPNGDMWLLVRDPANGRAFVRHQANIPAGGQVTDMSIDAFLSGPRNPEHEALVSLLGTEVPDMLGAYGDGAPTVAGGGRQWSDAELSELEDLLMCEIPIKEIARLLGRDHSDVRDKVAEVGRACR